MANILKVQSIWSGFIGSPGYTTLYFASPSPPPLTAIRNWFNSMTSLLPNIVSIQVQNAGDVIDDATGALTGSWATTAVTPVVGTSGSVYAAPAGLGVNFLTSSVFGGRRVRGRSFIVPLSSNAYQADGSLSPATLAAMVTGNAAFLAAVPGQLIIWHRPVGGAGGGSAPVTGMVTPDKVFVLRSRRD